MEVKREKKDNMLISIMGDEDTVTGFLLAGIGERNESTKNFFVLTKEDPIEVELIFKTLTSRRDIGILLISQHIADMIRETIDSYDKILPPVLEIPSRHIPYSIEKDSIMVKAYLQLYGKNISDSNLAHK
jgi:V-type H+-transporting ATPase subunit F